MVTPEFRFLSEAVSHEPPIVAMEMQGPGYKLFRCAESSQQFTGKKVKVIENHVANISLNVRGVGEEEFTSVPPTIVVGNLFAGKTFIEPQGAATIKNETNGYTCEIEFLPRKAQFGLIDKKSREQK